MASSILLIGADPDMARPIAGRLQASGHRVRSAPAETALGDVGDAQLVVLDLGPGPDDAAAFCRRIRATPGLARLLVLAIAQTDDADELVRLLEAGADDVMTKPVDLDELDARVEALVARSVMSRQRHAEPAGPVPSITRRRVVACYSPKGGVGTTTIAVNVALAGVGLGQGACALLDLDLQWGDVAAHLDLRPRQSVTELARDSFALADRTAMESYASDDPDGLWVFAGTGRPELEDPLRAEHIASLLNGIRSAYEVTFVDAGSVLDERTLTVLEHADRIIIPVVPEIPALRALHALLEILAEQDGTADRTLFVLNHLVPNETLGTADIERTLGAQVALELPYDPLAFHTAANEGKPVVRGAASGPAAAAMRRLAALVLDLPMEPEPTSGRRALASLLRRGRPASSSHA
jgi:pilus assembly protein CpaE